MTWEQRLQLLHILALGVDAAVTFNAEVALQQWQRRQQQQQASSPCATSAVQQQQNHAAAAAGNGSVLDSLNLASAVPQLAGSGATSALSCFGSYVEHPDKVHLC